MVNNFFSFIRKSSFASIISIFFVLTVAYSINLIYLIGDERQEIWLFAGIILGSIIFSYLGIISGKGWYLWSPSVSVISIILGTSIIFYNSMVINNMELFICSLLIISPLMPVVQIFNRKNSTVKSKILFSTSTMAFFIIIIFIFAILWADHTTHWYTILCHGFNRSFHFNFS